MKHFEAFKRDNILVDIIFQHKGKDNAIGTQELRRAMAYSGYTVSAEYVHSLVNKVVFERRIPICSVAQSGYYWATSKKDIQLAIDELQGKIGGLQERADLLKSFIFE